MNATVSCGRRLRRAGRHRGSRAKGLGKNWSLYAGSVVSSMDLIWQIRKRTTGRIANPVISTPAFAALQPHLEQTLRRRTEAGRRRSSTGPPLASISSCAACGAVGSRRIFTRTRIALGSSARGMAAPPQEQISQKTRRPEPIDHFHHRMRWWPDLELRPR